MKKILLSMLFLVGCSHTSPVEIVTPECGSFADELKSISETLEEEQGTNMFMCGLMIQNWTGKELIYVGLTSFVNMKTMEVTSMSSEEFDENCYWGLTEEAKRISGILEHMEAETGDEE